MLICACAVFAFGTTISARAEGKSVGEVTLTMDKGADVRLVNGNGMRFCCTISTADYDALTEQYGEGNFSFGIFLMPKGYETNIGAINYDNTFGESPLYIWGDGAISAVVDGKYRILHMETLPVENGDVYKMYGSVINMLDANVGLDYVACAYVKAGAEVKFADTTARSIVEVALRALNSGDYDAMATEKAVLNGYVETFTDNYKAANGGEEPAFDYTVRYVADGVSVGTTVVEDVEMNSGVTTRITAPSGYALNRSSIISGYVYAKDVSVDVEVISATAISSESDLHNKYLKESNLNYSIEDDIDCTTATSITHNSWITADGIIDGKGHIITDPVIDDDITSYGLVGARFGNGLESPAAIRDLAVVNLTNSYRNYLSYETNCGRIENCYFSGSCKYHDIFEYIYGGGVTLKNVILDCYCSVDGYALGIAGESGAANVVYDNVIQLYDATGLHPGSTYGGTLMTYEEF
ncbi:MAG: hypothetical protein J6Y43_01110, partial [Clostridia bacterium]|nr:hypothetical protein [Clostridia bacterium]